MNLSPKQILLIKIVIAIVYLAIVIGVEFAYREPLFEKSLSIEETIQNNISKAGKEYFEFITHFGELKVTLAFVALVFIFFPLTKSFAFLSIYIYGYYFTNLMKMMYHSPRPFWLNPNLDPVCNTGFGNPSGHSVTTFSLYLSLFHMTTDFDFFKKNKKGLIIRIGIFILYFLLMLSIITSRIVLGAHSINQVLYGSLLGIAIYFIIFHIMSYSSMNNIEFYDHIYNYISISIYSLIYSVLFFFNLFYYLFGQYDVQQYVDIIMRLCPWKKDYQLLYHDGFLQSISITGLIGAHFGILLLYYFSIKKYTLSKALYINEWNSNGTVVNFFIRLPIIAVSTIFILLMLIQSEYLWVLFIFKAALAYGLGIFGAFSVGIYVCVILGRCNANIYVGQGELIKISHNNGDDRKMGEGV